MKSLRFSIHREKWFRVAALALLAIFAVQFNEVLAQQAGVKRKKPFKIMHRPLTASQLPMPGESLLLSVRLKNWSDTSRVLRIVVVKDGRIMNLALNNSYLNDYDEPTFDVRLQSPQVSLEYQFFIEGPDGEFVKSDKFSLRRECVPDVLLEDVAQNPQMQISERIPLMIRQAEKLELELTSYETTTELLKELKKVVKE